MANPYITKSMSMSDSEEIYNFQTAQAQPRSLKYRSKINCETISLKKHWEDYISIRNQKINAHDATECEGCGKSLDALENTCTRCGVVVENCEFPKYSTFITEDKNRSIGAIPEFGTMVGKPSEAKGDFKRLRWTNEVYFKDYSVRIKKFALVELDYLISVNFLPPSCKDEALALFFSMWEQETPEKRSVNREAECAAALYVVCQNREIYTDFKMFEKNVRANRKKYRKILTKYKYPNDRYNKIFRLIHAHAENTKIEQLAKRIVQKAPIFVGNTTLKVAAGVSLSVARILNSGKSKRVVNRCATQLNVGNSPLYDRIHKLFRSIDPNMPTVSKLGSKDIQRLRTYFGLKSE